MSEFSVHPSSIIDSGASIGEGTRIWHFCHIMPLAVIGKNCNIGQNVFIDNGVKVGNGVKIQNNVSLYNGVELADDVFIGPSVVFTNVINPRSAIERKDEFRATWVGKGATIGANATIVCGVKIGEYALIGAGAVVTRDVDAYAVIVGNPGTLSGWVNSRGNKLVFNEQGEAESDGERFRKHEGRIMKA
jgi:UDP-2-acetamido-3-amino-2,3-dideoxy-glucuronate N-acetyltransferase